MVTTMHQKASIKKEFFITHARLKIILNYFESTCKNRFSKDKGNKDLKLFLLFCFQLQNNYLFLWKLSSCNENVFTVDFESAILVDINTPEVALPTYTVSVAYIRIRLVVIISLVILTLQSVITCRFS